MSFYDEVRSNFQGLNGYFQTKDFDNLMWVYYIDPAGHFWQVDYSGTSDLVLESFVGKRFPRVTHTRNGNHGRVTPFYYTGTLHLTELDKDENLFNWEVNFVDGVLQSFFLLGHNNV